MPSDEKFFAWLDGELDSDEAARVEEEVTADAKLGALAAKHRALQARLNTAFGTILDAPVPDSLTASVERESRADVIDFGARGTPRAWRILPLGALMAATLAVGILVGTVIPPRPTAPVEAQGSKLYAAAALDTALSTQLASAPQGDTRIGLTFRNRAGAICRSFTARASTGLACREDDRWALKGILAAPEGQSGDYRMAGGANPALTNLIDLTIAGMPLDAAEERAARDSGWR